jgi:HD superfamily phosphohydrolase
MDDVPESVIEADHDRIEELERAVADRADVAEREVILDVPPEPEMRESSTRVLVGGEVRRLDEQSPLVGTLRAAHREQWRLGVYAPREHTDRVGRAARSVLGLEAEALLSEVQRPGDATLDEFE